MEPVYKKLSLQSPIYLHFIVSPSLRLLLIFLSQLRSLFCLFDLSVRVFALFNDFPIPFTSFDVLHIVFMLAAKVFFLCF